MPSIILPGRWLTQPQGPVDLDSNNPITNGMVSALLPGLDVYSRIPAVMLGNNGREAFREGLALKGDGATLHGAPLPKQLGAQISFFGAGRITRSAGTSVTLGLCSSAGNALFGTQFSTITNSFGRILQRQVNAGSAVVLNFTAPQTTSFFDYATFGATSNNLGTAVNVTTLWNGLRDLNSNLSTTGDNTVYDRFAMGGWWQATPSYAAAGNDYAIGLAWDRLVSDEEYAALHANPWQIFKPRRRILYFDVASGGGTPVNVSDTLTPGLTETQTSLVSSSVTEGLTPSLVEVVALLKNPEFVSVTDTLSVSVTEALALLATSIVTDTLTPGLTESASLNTGAFEVAVTDGLTPSVTEAQTSLVSSAIAEALTLTLGEVQGSLLFSTVAEVFSISVSESVALLVAVTPTDTLVVSITDTSGLVSADVIAKEVADALAPYFTEVGTLELLDAWQHASSVVGVWTLGSAGSGTWTAESGVSGTWTEDSSL